MFKRNHSSHGSLFNPPPKYAGLKKFLVLVVVFAMVVVALGAAFMGFQNYKMQAPIERTLAYAGKNACEFRFEGTGVSLMQSHCEHNKGVYVMTTTGMMTAPLIDPSVEALLNQHGCDAPNRCQFHLSLGRKAVQGQFEYTINGQQGFYEFRWPKDDEPQLVKSSTASSNI
ncbi:hypothetical protein [Limnobacter sp.]|uniref:hypothetical protein n=1 Tax=Limnobacter sp. TaxID=2003368 RepID=UPI0035186B4C